MVGRISFCGQRGLIASMLFGTLLFAFSSVPFAAVREFKITVEEKEIVIAGVSFQVWAFNGQVPGPEIRVKEGDTLRVIFKNTHGSESHTIHWHGLHPPFAMDGVPDISQKAVKPGETFIYEFKVHKAGTYMYHCHVDTSKHLDMGMYGPLIVEPRVPDLKMDKEYVFMLDEWNGDVAAGNSEFEAGHPRGMSGYNFFTINGKAFPDVPPITVKKGEKVRVRLIHAGYLTHAMHMHGHEFTVTHKDGKKLKSPTVMDTLSISPGERYDLVFTANNPGTWLFHCHVVPHVTNGGSYPGGLIIPVVYQK